MVRLLSWVKHPGMKPGGMKSLLAVFLTPDLVGYSNLVAYLVKEIYSVDF